MAKYVLSKKAVDDLSKIWNYTYEVWSENQADIYYELIIETFYKVAKNQSLGKNYKEISDKLLGYNVGKHIIFYRIINSKEIEIIRILHQRMNLKNKIDE